MTAKERVAEALAVLDPATETLPAVDDELRVLAHGLQIWILIITTDAATMLGRLDMLETLAAVLRHPAEKRTVQRAAANQARYVAAFGQAFSDVCEALAGHPAGVVERAASGFLSERMEVFRTRWPAVVMDAAAYQEHVTMLAALWQDCVPLRPTPLAEVQ